ncbi:MAG: GDP-mannose 4,6-dehydratase [Spirochaetales bacterium]|nr:GDP-mannose 4,6-dehydratase [Spirochaetales bacterium]
MNAESSILITGSSGLAGTWLVRALREKGYRRLSLLDIEDTAGEGRYTGSICDRAFTEEVIRTVRPNCVFHLAGIVGHRPDSELVEVNVRGTELLLASLCMAGLSSARVLIASSSAVYGDKGETPITEDSSSCPANGYGRSKLMQEYSALSFFSRLGLRVIVSRAFNNTAPGEKPHMFVSRIASQIAEVEAGLKEKLSIGPLHSYRDYLDTRDVVDAYIALMKSGIPGEIYNVCSGKAIKVEDLFLTLIRQASRPVPYEVIEYDQRGNIPYQCGSSAKLNEATGWKAKRDITVTLGEILSYWRRKIKA